jgi:molybdenum-dependent DNA-binding transcriptional regulator ModE
MSTNVVHVKNISKETSEKEIKDFFSFCGKITQLEVTSAGETQNATVTFEKETAAKTALLLDNTQLGSTQVSVSSATGGDDFGHSSTDTDEGDEIIQEQKPRSRIIAEYLAHGYLISDQTAEKAIDLDKKHGISSRFLDTLTKLDQRTQASSKAKVVDEKYDITNKATQTISTIWSGINSYYEKAAGTPTGQKLVDFYTKSSQQVQDIHAEARRLADLKKKETGGHDVKNVSGTDKTTCGCGGDSQVCGCAAGQCACSSCPKSDSSNVGGTEKNTSVHETAQAGTGIIADSQIKPLEK